MKAFKILFFALLTLGAQNLFSQYDVAFYCPPVADFQDQNMQLVMATSYPSAIVNVRSPDGVIFNQNFTVTNGAPTVVNFTTQIGAYGAKVSGLDLTFINSIRSNAGLYITANIPITAVLRVNRNNNQELIPLKGRVGLGTVFRAGSQTLTTAGKCGGDAEQNSHFISVMATEDNTTVTITNPNAGGIQGAPAFPITLNRFQSFMVRTPTNSATNQLSGALITSDRPIAVTTGGNHLGHQLGGACDAGIDNIYPTSEIANEYIFARGLASGSANQDDYVFVVAQTNGTQVRLNGVLQGTINAGQFLNILTPAGPLGAPHQLLLSNPGYAFHVTNQSSNEVGMSILPGLVCRGSRYIEFVRQTPLTNNLYVIIETASLASFRYNGQPFGFYGVVPTAVPNRPDYSTLSFSDATVQTNNVMLASTAFHVGLVAAQVGNTGLYGFLTGYDEDFRAFDPVTAIPTVQYSVGTLCRSTALTHSMVIQGCSPPFNIISATPRNGAATGTISGISGVTFTFTSSATFTGSDFIDVIVQDNLGRQISVALQVTFAGGGSCPENCTNVVDDDGDGLTDCTDPDCAATASIAAGGPTTFCQGGSVLLTAGPAGAAAYLWSTGANTPSISATTAGTFAVTVTNAFSCTASANRVVTVNSGPPITISGVNTICSGASSTFTASGAVSYAWSTGANTAAISVSTAGVYTVTGTAANGCTASTSRTLSVNPLPSVSISGTNIICGGGTSTFTASGALNYTWSTGAVGANITVSVAGTYSVTGTDASGCSASASRTLTINANPTVSIAGTNIICSGATSTFTASGAVSYVWSTGAVTSSIPVNSAGAYSVTGTSANGCSASATRTLVVNTSPTVSIAGTNVICTGASSTFTASGATTYAWSTGANTASISVNTAGTYTVTGSDANGCTATANRVLTVNANPVVGITGINSICSGASTTLTANGANTYLWSTGANTPAITVNTPGTYTVTGTDANGCSGTANRILTVNTNPTVSVSGVNTICAGAASTFTASGATSYLWSTGANTASISVNTAGTYTVTGTDPNGCSATANRVLTVNTNPVVAISGTNVVCSGVSSTFTASGAATYIWSTGENTASITVSTAGTYTVTGSDANGCSATANRLLTVNTTPTMSIAGTNVVCAGTSSTFTASGASTYLWSTGANTPAITVNIAGTYTVTGTNANGCTATANRIFTVNPNPVISNVAATAQSCPVPLGDGSIVITASVTTGSLLYSIDNGGTSQVSNTFTNLGNGTFNIIVSVQGTGCQVAFGANPVVLAGPTSCGEICNNGIDDDGNGLGDCLDPGCSATVSISASGPTTFCAGGSVTLTALPAGAASYAWNTGANTAAITPNTSGNYVVTLTNAQGCTASAQRSVTVNANPVLNISGTNVVCSGVSSTFTASGAPNFIWSTGANTAAITVNTAGIFTVTGTDANGCSATANRTLTVNTNPVVSIAGTNVVCAGVSSTFTASGASTYSWSTGANTAAITVNTAGIYAVTGTHANGCTATASLSLTVNTNPVVAVAGTNVVCAGVSSTFTASGASTYSWSTGANTAAITVNTAGIYTVTGTDGNGCTATANRTLTVNTNPIVSIIGTNVICAGVTSTFTAGGALTYSWSTGANTAAISVNTAGIYAVTGTDANGCTATANRTLTVNTNPVVSLAGTTVVCSGASSTFTASGATTYSWSTGANTAAITVNTAGIYAVTGTDGNGCTATANRIFTINPNPVILNILATPQSCPVPLNDGSITITASILSGTLEYSINNGTTFQVGNAFTGLSNGSFNVIVREPTTGCFTANVGNPIVLNGPTNCGEICNNGIDDDGNGLTDCLDPNCAASAGISANGPTTFCAGGSVVLTATPAGATAYTWSTGVNTTAITVSSSGNFVVTVTNAQGCTASALRTVIVNANPVMAVTGTNVVCFAATTTFTASGASSYLWNTGGNTVSLTVNSAGTYTVTGTDANGCTGTANRTLSFFANPVVSIAGTNVVCAGASSNFTASGAVSYVWSTGANTAAISVNTAGTYTVTGTDANGCTGTDNRSLTVNPNPVVSGVTPTNPACPFPFNDGSIVVSASIATGVLEYSINGGTSYQASPSFTGLSAGNFVVVARGQGTTCTTPFAANPVTLTNPGCAEICNDLVDNDGNGLADCNDPSCQITVTVTYGGPYCQNVANPTPTVSTPGGTFSATPAGLALNILTGEINLSASQIGTYVISYTIPQTLGNCGGVGVANVAITPIPNSPANLIRN